MKVTATTLPRRSARASRRPSCAVRTKSGAGPIRDSRASPLAGCAAVWVAPVPSRRAASNAAPVLIVTAERSRFELLPKLPEDAPVRPIGDELLRVRRDEAGLAQSKPVEAHRVLWIERSPCPVVQLTDSLAGILVGPRVTTVHDKAGHSLGVPAAQIRPLQDGPHRPLGRHRMLSMELPVRCHHTAEVLRPRTVAARVDENAADLPGAQLLGVWRDADEAAHLLVGEQLHGLRGGVDHPLDVLARVEAHLVEHDARHRELRAPALRSGTAIVRPLRSRIDWTWALPKSTVQPVCTPPRTVIESPASRCIASRRA